MLHFNKIKSDSDISLYQSLYWEKSGRKAPIKLIGQGQSYFVTRKGQIIGGYSLNTSNQLRTPTLVPERVSVSFPSGPLAEVNALWLDKSWLLRIIFVIFLFIKLRQSQTATIIAYTTKDKLYHKTYAIFGAVILYQGPLRTKPESTGIVFAITPINLLKNLSYYLFYRSRQNARIQHRPGNCQPQI